MLLIIRFCNVAATVWSAPRLSNPTRGASNASVGPAGVGWAGRTRRGRGTGSGTGTGAGGGPRDGRVDAVDGVEAHAGGAVSLAPQSLAAPVSRCFGRRHPSTRQNWVHRLVRHLLVALCFRLIPARPFVRPSVHPSCQCQCQSNVYIAPKVEGRIWGTGMWVTRRDRQKRKGEI